MGFTYVTFLHANVACASFECVKHITKFFKISKSDLNGIQIGIDNYVIMIPIET